MTQRRNHYEAAFEEYLRGLGEPYIAVDEQRRSLLGEASLKSVDFLLRTRDGETLLIDIKGRRGGHRENWVTADDVASLLTWQEVFGPQARALLVFAYSESDDLPRDRTDLQFGGRYYRFDAVGVAEYQSAMKPRSPRWDTFWVAAEPFARLARSFESYLHDVPRPPVSQPR